MGTTPKQVLETNAAFTDGYTDGLVLGTINVRGNDLITLLLTGISAVTTLTLKFQESGNDVFRESEGETLLEEIVHTVANGTNVALRLNTTGLSDLTIHIKGNASGTIQEVAVLLDGSGNNTPKFSE